MQPSKQEQQAQEGHKQLITLYKQMLPLLHGHQAKALFDYLVLRIDTLHQSLERCDEKELRKIQGQITELKSLLALPERINQALK